MADRKVQMSYYNGASYDNLYPKTMGSLIYGTPYWFQTSSYTGTGEDSYTISFTDSAILCILCQQKLGVGGFFNSSIQNAVLPISSSNKMIVNVLLSNDSGQCGATTLNYYGSSSSIRITDDSSSKYGYNVKNVLYLATYLCYRPTI